MKYNSTYSLVKRAVMLYSAVDKGPEHMTKKHYDDLLQTLQERIVEKYPQYYDDNWLSEERRQAIQQDVLKLTEQVIDEFTKQHHITLEQISASLALTPLPRTIPTLPDIFANGHALTSSALTIQAVIHAQHNAASGGDKWQRPEGHPPFYSHTTKAGSTIIEYLIDRNAVLDERATASLYAQVREFTDLDSDVLLGMLAHMIKGPRESDGSVWFFASNMLDYRGIQPIMKADTPGSKKRRAGHRQEDILEIGKCVDRAANIWLTIDQFIQEEPATGKKKRGKRKEYTHKGRLLSVDEVWYQRELDMGNNASNSPIGWRVRPGAWLQTFLETPNRQVAWLCQQTLQYDPYREQWEKRLAKYLMFHIRMNGGGGQFNREIGPLLLELSLNVDKSRPERTKQRFEKAMNRLVQDRQIDEWEYTETIDYRARKWIETWLTNRITIYIAPAKQDQSPSK